MARPYTFSIANFFVRISFLQIAFLAALWYWAPIHQNNNQDLLERLHEAFRQREQSHNVSVTSYGNPRYADVSTPISPSTVEATNDSFNNDGHQGSRIPIFYNLYVSNASEIPRVSKLVQEQFSMIPPEKYGPIYVISIGTTISTIFDDFEIGDDGLEIIEWRHYDKGGEALTLQALWSFCRDRTADVSSDPKNKVVYLHSKGSHTNSVQNDGLRRFLTKAVLSDECRRMGGNGTTEESNACDVCSARFSPLPHPHCSGNMWMATCPYIQSLIEPAKFRRRMHQVYNDIRPNFARKHSHTSCFGLDRYSMEHWVHSQRTVRPCDVYPSSNFTWGYKGLPTEEDGNAGNALVSGAGTNGIWSLAPAPRFDLSTYYKPSLEECEGPWHTQIHRQNDTLSKMIELRQYEYQALYGDDDAASVNQSWWGRKFFALP